MVHLRKRRSVLSASLGVLWLALAIACTNNNSTTANNSTPADAAGKTDTPRGPVQPRTSPPLPPVSAAHAPGGGAPAASAPQAGAQSWTMLDGRRVRASEYKGKVLVLDFWATYCPPCREEVPHLIALQKRYGARGLNIVGLNVGGDEDRPKVASFVQEFGISYPLGYPDEGMTQLVFADTDAIPQTYVFDRNGRLVKRFVGYDSASATALETAVQTALATN
jgi:cytochrome c biogenesis protein CcmG/thiol:disulfide interchange protein DsbE